MLRMSLLNANDDDASYRLFNPGVNLGINFILLEEGKRKKAED